MDTDKTLTALNAQIEYARTHCEFYRNLPIAPLQALDELAQLPFTTQEDLAQGWPRLLCCPASQVRRMVTLQTSGTSGSPKRLAFSDRDLEDTVDFFHHGMHLLCGTGDTVSIFFAGGHQDGLCKLLSSGISRFDGIPLVYGAIRDYDDAAAFCRRVQPQVLVGTPLQLRRLALHAPELRPLRVLVSADYAAPALLDTISRVWHCQALNHYGLTESGLGCAVETPAQDGMHIRAGILLETLPDGELVLTTLRREAMPLLRYRTGDLGKLLPNGNLGAVFGRKKLLEQRVSIYALDALLLGQDDILDYSAKLQGQRLQLSVAGDTASAERLLAGAFPELDIQVVQDRTVLSDGIHKRML